MPNNSAVAAQGSCNNLSKKRQICIDTVSGQLGSLKLKYQLESQIIMAVQETNQGEQKAKRSGHFQMTGVRQL